VFKFEYKLHNKVEKEFNIIRITFKLTFEPEGFLLENI
jgi:hypothetical protein